MTFTTDHQSQVAAMHQAFNHPVRDTPGFPGSPEERERLRILRTSLIQEELDELKEALANNDIIEVADALADILVVTLGAAVVYGIDLGPVFDEVMRSNMSKLGEDGKPVPHPTVPGKFGKGPNYSKPDIARILSAQIARVRG